MKLSTIKLIGILAALVVIYGIVQLTSGRKKSKSLRSDLVSIDTARVTAVNIQSTKGEVKLNKEADVWNLTLPDGKVVPAAGASVKNALGSLLTIKPSQITTRNEQKWKDYQVDSTGTRVQVNEGTEKTLDLVIGRFAMQGQGAYQTFVRLFAGKEVYAVNNFMSFSVPADAASYRNKILARMNKDSLLNISFSYPADSSFQLTKAGDVWTVNGQPADSASVAGYVSGLGYVSGNTFVDDREGLIAPIISATFQFTSGSDITIDGYEKEDGWVFHSSENEDGYFSDANLLTKIFKGASEFVK